MEKAEKEKIFLNNIQKVIAAKAKAIKGTSTITIQLTVTQKQEGCWIICQTDDDGNVYCYCEGDCPDGCE